jgi:hypothetical protein
MKAEVWERNNKQSLGLHSQASSKSGANAEDKTFCFGKLRLAVEMICKETLEHFVMSHVFQDLLKKFSSSPTNSKRKNGRYRYFTLKSFVR